MSAKLIIPLKLFFVISFIFVQSLTVKASDGNIESLRFRETDIRTVIRSIAAQAYRDGRKVNIVTGPEVTGLVTVELQDIDWLAALEVVIRPFDYGYEWVRENTIVVDDIEKIAEREVRDRQRQQVELPDARVFTLKYLDANDVKKMVGSLLSEKGKVQVLEVVGQAGWEFGIDTPKRGRVSDEDGRISRTKVLVVSDTLRRLEQIERLLEEIDIRPKQVLIQARIMEVEKDLLDDLGFQWTATEIDLSSSGTKQIRDSGILSGIEPPIADPTLDILFRKIGGTKFEALLKAVEKNEYTNVLSSPTLLTLDGQEAKILLGEQFPIVETTLHAQTGEVTGGILRYYEDIGVELNVAPKIVGAEQDIINIIIHPSVKVDIGKVEIAAEEKVLAAYPILRTREAVTQGLIRSGETIVIGGLLEDRETKLKQSVPFLGEIPLLGRLFRREREVFTKVDLIVTVTAYIVDIDEVDLVQLADYEEIIEKFSEKIKDE